MRHTVLTLSPIYWLQLCKHQSSWFTNHLFLFHSRPKSGSMLLYSRKKVRYRRDGYCWKKRKDGKTTREDHMKLKVQGTEVNRVFHWKETYQIYPSFKQFFIIHQNKSGWKSCAFKAWSWLHVVWRAFKFHL